MKKKNILAGLLGLSLMSPIPYGAIASAAEPTVQQIEELNEIMRQVKAARAELKAKGIDTSDERVVRAERKTPAKKAKKEREVPEEKTEGAGDFAVRIEKILSELRTKPTPTPRPAVQAETPQEDQTLFATPEEEKERYSFDWRGTPLAQSLYSVAKIAGKGIVVNGKLDDTVYVSLNNVTCTQAIQYLSSSFDFNWLIDGDNLVVSTDDVMLQSKIFPVGFVDKTIMRDEFVALGIKEENIFANAETGTVSVTGTPYQLKEAEKRLKRLDHPVAQCLLLAQLIEIQHGKSLDLGLTYTLPTYTHTGQDSVEAPNPLKGKILGKLSFAANAYASRELSKGRVIARPIVMSINGHKGVVNFGDSVPVLTKTDTGSSSDVTVTYQDIGTKLEMTPVINSENEEISLNLSLEVSTITGWVTSGQTRAPQMSKRTAETSARIKSGQSFVIGGLMSKKDLDNLSGIPGLMNLPILGKLFSYRTKSTDYSEIYIMITPFIVTNDINVQEMYDKLGSKDGVYNRKNPKLNLPDKDWADDLSGDN